MASLVVADPDGIVVDFHSHTDVSHNRWTVLKIRGWRDLSAASLDEAILATLRSGDASRVVVIERASPIAQGKAIKFANHSAFVRNPLATLTLPEQLAWISWAWFAWWIVQVTRRRHDRGRLNRSV